MIAMVKTDVHECEMLAVLLFDDLISAAQYLAKEYNLTHEEQGQIRDEQGALLLTVSDGSYKYVSDEEVCEIEYPHGSVAYESVCVEDHQVG